MCGILGAFGESAKDRRLDPAVIAHRGPDASGEWTSPDGRCWLGHTRLAIVELSPAGAQPMASASDATVIVFNGEIYNHLEVRKELPGIAWRGHSDTETLLEAWEAWGEAALDRLRGMFAFAVFDQRDGSLVIVRDRLGIKPVYFRREKGGGVAFASEVRALNAGQRLTLNQVSLATYLGTGHLPGEGPIGSGIEMLGAGQSISFFAEGPAVAKRWWPGRKSTTTASSGKPPEIGRGEAKRRVRELVEESVREHLMADVPIASFLSGGIDSSIVSLVAAKHHSEPLRTFSVGFPDEKLDERPIARLVADRAGAIHTEVEVSPSDCLKWVREAVAALDVPSVDAINTYIVSKAVRREGIKVALSGLGGDELFGGYPSFQDVRRLAFLGWLPTELARRVVACLPGKARDKLSDCDRFDAFQLALHRRSWWPTDALRAAGVDERVRWPEPTAESKDAFAAISWAEILGYMEPMLLRDTDQMSMAVSLELRVPFLDHRLIEYVLNLPAKLKSGKPPKRLLIESFKEDLPKEVWNRPKQGFTLPMDHWIRGPLKAFAKTGVDAAREVANADWVDSVAMSFESGNTHWTRLWQIVVLGHYANRTRSVVPASELKEILAD